MKNLFSLFVTLLVTTSLWAYDFQSGELYYNITNDTVAPYTVEVTSKSSDFPHYNEGVTFATATIPETVTYNGTTYSVTSIGRCAFLDCRSLTSVTIPDGVTSIVEFAFEGCHSLTSVTIPNSVTSIGDAAFRFCKSLASVTIPAGITSIKNGVFEGCSSLTSVTIPDGVTSIGGSAFYGCSSLASVTIPNSVTGIGYYAFSNCTSLTSVTIPDGVTSIGEEVFASCSSLTSITWEAESVFEYSEVSDVPFYDIRSQITEFVFGNKVQYIPAHFCYEMEKLTSVTIGNSVMRIGNAAFSGCSALREITLPASLKNIDSNAFAGTPRLYEVTCLAPEPPIAEESSFTNYDAYFHAYCDAQRYYRVDPVWKKFHNVECIVNENTVTNNVTVTPSDCEATVVWLSNDAATAYSLVITKNGTNFCTLRFNQYGQLTNVAFAPSRTHDKQQAAETTSTGYSFTITGLDAGTKYDYQFSVLNDTNESIDEYFGEFTTKSNVTTDMDNISSPVTNSQKFLRNGQLIILRDGKTYTTMGAEM